MPKIDPTDVAPVRNLPDEAEPWGRSVDTDIRLFKRTILSIQASLRGLSRSFAASFQQLSGQLNNLSAQQSELNAAQSDILAAQQRLSETNEVFSTTININSNTTQAPRTSINLFPPAWANSALITGSVAKISGTTTREVILYSSASGPPTPSYPGGPIVCSYFVTGGEVAVQELSQPSVFTNFTASFPYDRVTIYTDYNVMVSGTGTQTVELFIFVTWIE